MSADVPDRINIDLFEFIHLNDNVTFIFSANQNPRNYLTHTTDTGQSYNRQIDGESTYWQALLYEQTFAKRKRRRK